MTVKLEVGKKYRMRNGGWCFVVDTCSSRTYPFLIYIHGLAGTASFTEYGTPNQREESEYDIISEWKEPRTVYINVYDRHGLHITNCFYATRSMADEKSVEEINGSSLVKRIACIKVIEGTYDV